MIKFALPHRQQISRIRFCGWQLFISINLTLDATDGANQTNILMLEHVIHFTLHLMVMLLFISYINSLDHANDIWSHAPAGVLNVCRWNIANRKNEYVICCLCAMSRGLELFIITPYIQFNTLMSILKTNFKDTYPPLPPDLLVIFIVTFTTLLQYDCK